MYGTAIESSVARHSLTSARARKNTINVHVSTKDEVADGRSKDNSQDEICLEDPAGNGMSIGGFSKRFRNINLESRKGEEIKGSC